MPITTKILKQTAVYWAKTGVDVYGIPTWGTPTEIDVRWEDVVREFVTSDGSRQLSQAIVYTGIDITIGGFLLLGTLSSSVVQDDPRDNDGAWEVRGFEKLPDFRARNFLRTAIL